ncbi:uncharacterized protein LOC127728827 [Mytilus californianus]|uniref:uncharacterized protein LOC127728827 n=1 Tax=Mytilus californianus TaxID=6549 RepID=UPI002247DC47|nr:uncharacterized protein LOC127728827 [Mytilus californianus]
MSWTFWICLKVLITFCLAYDNIMNTAVQYRQPLYRHDFDSNNFQQSFQNAVSFQIIDNIKKEEIMNILSTYHDQMVPLKSDRSAKYTKHLQKIYIPVENIEKNNQNLDPVLEYMDWRNEPMRDEEEEEDLASWKDFFENSVSWTPCETFVHGLSFIPLILRDTVFRDWAVEQACQEIFFRFVVPPITNVFGVDYRNLKF